MRPHDPGKLSWWWGDKLWRKHTRRLPRSLRKGIHGQKRSTGAQQQNTLWHMLHS